MFLISSWFWIPTILQEIQWIQCVSGNLDVWSTSRFLLYYEHLILQVWDSYNCVKFLLIMFCSCNLPTSFFLESLGIRLKLTIFQDSWICLSCRSLQYMSECCAISDKFHCWHSNCFYQPTLPTFYISCPKSQFSCSSRKNRKYFHLWCHFSLALQTCVSLQAQSWVYQGSTYHHRW